MAAQRAVTTYAAPSTFLLTDQWKQLNAALLSQLPLHNLHWKSQSRSIIRTIQALDVKFVPLETLRDELTTQVPQTLLEKPLLNLYFALCEDNETYRATVRKQIKDWHGSVSQRKNQEWLIVHVVRPEGRTAQGRMFQMRTSVLDKVKADFNTDKRDRCVQLAWSTDFDNPAAWADFVNKLKDGIMSAFDSALSQREEEVKRSEGQRQMPGWNFCTFFILKESLAISFEGMNLYEEALLQYDELESSFFQVVRDKNLSWFGVLILPSTEDDSLPILSVTKKPYRELILANSISVFDFRIYLLARQCVLLSKLGSIVEIGKKAVIFISGFGRRLRDVEGILPIHFIESWTYSSALSVVEQCDVWANHFSLSRALLANFSAIKGELLELARHQLDIIGIRVGHLPSRPPFSIALPVPVGSTASTSKPKDHRSSQEISRADLLSSIKDKEAFYELYVQITNRAIELYANSGRRKFALKLHGNLAALDVFRDRLPSALQTYRNLPAHYAPHGWISLEAFMLTHALNLYSSSEQARDRDWIYLVLEFLKAYVEDLGKELLIDADDHKAYISGLISAFKSAADELQSDVIHPDHPALSIIVASKTVRLAETRDGALLDVVVRNRLPCDIPIDELIVQMVGRETTRLSFSHEAAVLASGETNLTLFCPSSSPGTYALQSSQIRISRFVFQWKGSKLTGVGKAPRLKELPSLVLIPRDLRAVDVRIRQQQCIQLGEARKVVLILHTGRNDVSSATLRVTAAGVDFRYSEATIDDEVAFQTTADSITVLNVLSGSLVSVSVPHSDASAFNPMRVNISVDYITASEPHITRNVKIVRVIATSLPVSINVEDFFRGTRLFTRFTLSTTSHQHIRIKSTKLVPLRQGTDDLTITSCLLQRPSTVTITPTQSAQFLFQLDAARGQAREPLNLRIAYRTLREEVESLIHLAVDAVVTESPNFETHRDVVVDRLVQALESNASWVELYGITREVVVPGLRDEEDDIGVAIRRAKEILSKGKSDDEDDFGDWREILIPVDVPQMHVLAATRLEVRTNPFSDTPSKKSPPLFAGQPIFAVVSVTTSFHWVPVEDKKRKSFVLRYDIEETTQDWLVSGRKRGDFTAHDGETFTVPITLIALHHGELSLPQIGITALPLPSIPGPELSMQTMIVPSCETYQLHGAEKVFVLPRGGRSTFVVSMGQDENA